MSHSKSREKDDDHNNNNNNNMHPDIELSRKLIVRATRYEENKRYGDAIEDLRTASKLNPYNFIPHSVLGKIYTILGRHEDAWKERDKVVRMTKGNDPASYHHRALAYTQLGKLQEALSDAERCVKLSDPKNWHAWFTRGTVLTLLTEHDRAIDDFRRVLAVFSGNRKACLSIGLCRLAQNRLDEAENALLDVFNDPKAEREIRGLAQYNLGVISEKRLKNLTDDDDDVDRVRLMEKAIHLYTRAVSLLPNSADRAECEDRIIKLNIKLQPLLLSSSSSRPQRRKNRSRDRSRSRSPKRQKVTTITAPPAPSTAATTTSPPPTVVAASKPSISTTTTTNNNNREKIAQFVKELPPSLKPPMTWSLNEVRAWISLAGGQLTLDPMGNAVNIYGVYGDAARDNGVDGIVLAQMLDTKAPLLADDFFSALSISNSVHRTAIRMRFHQLKPQ